MPIPLSDDSLSGHTENAQLMIHAATRFLQQQGVGAEEAKKMGAALIELLMVEFGGVYMPRGIQLRAVRLHQQIRSEFTGHNHKELARKHKLTEQAIRGIVNKPKRQSLSNPESQENSHAAH
jgi:Mor family transcriptional regulator